MSKIHRIDLGCPSLLEFRGPDAVRFLNGQLTQDVRLVAGGNIALPSCVTDAKGRLQFRVTVTEAVDGALWIAGLAGWAEDLEARLTRYLIADDVEVSDLSGKCELHHFTGPMPDPPAGVVARESNRFGVGGTDWWIPVGMAVEFSGEIPLLEGDALEALRIANGVPAWGRELLEGMLPPEASLEETDISYHKGCYIGQEVISRIKSAGKVNKRLAHFVFNADVPVTVGPLGNAAGEVTSVSPLVIFGVRHALGYVKRGATDLFFKAADGSIYPVITESPPAQPQNRV
jgi:folate-binding protein YgfZ